MKQKSLLLTTLLCLVFPFTNGYSQCEPGLENDTVFTCTVCQPDTAYIAEVDSTCWGYRDITRIWQGQWT